MAHMRGCRMVGSHATHDLLATLASALPPIQPEQQPAENDGSNGDGQARQARRSTKIAMPKTPTKSSQVYSSGNPRTLFLPTEAHTVEEGWCAAHEAVLAYT
jgi:hypothetical protein